MLCGMAEELLVHTCKRLGLCAVQRAIDEQQCIRYVRMMMMMMIGPHAG